jgi:hypothetical protein
MRKHRLRLLAVVPLTLAACELTVVMCERETSRAGAPEPPEAALTSPPPASTGARAPVLAGEAPKPDTAPSATAGAHPWPESYRPPEVWETRNVVLAGTTETWSLVWRKPPRFNGCDPGYDPGYYASCLDNTFSALKNKCSFCACNGLEWGLVGELDLVRERPGAPVERLDLAAVPGAVPGEGAQIPGFARSPLDDAILDEEHQVVRPGQTIADAVKRPKVEVMQLRDYDHDGWAAEFVFQVGYWACGLTPSVLVGVSRTNPHLHVFGSVASRDSALTMEYVWVWDRILAARGKTVEVTFHECGDHGGGGSYMTLAFVPGGLAVVDAADWECDFPGDPHKRTRRIPPERPDGSATR